MNLYEPTHVTLARTDAQRIADSIRSRAGDFEREEALDADVFRELGAKGLMAALVPKRFGGSEIGARAYTAAMVEIADVCASTAVTMSVTNMVGEVIAKLGTAEQAQYFCPRLAAGALGGFALSEADAGSDPAAMRTVAVLEGDEWRINGTKQWISHGDLADVLVLWARTDGPGARGLSCFLVPQGSKGLTIASREHKMGLRASHTVALSLDDLRLPASALLGERGAGFRYAMMALDGGRIGIASQSLGIARGAYRHAIAACRDRDVSEGARFALADMKTMLDASELMVGHAAALKDAGKPFSQEASMAKAFVTEKATQLIELACKVAGPDAYLYGHPLERARRDVRVTMIYEGTSEIQRVVIARNVLNSR